VINRSTETAIIAISNISNKSVNGNPKKLDPDEVGSGVGVDIGSVHLHALFELSIL
jgi:hypothetical protein